MIRKGYSFDDVLIVPAYNDIKSRKNVDLGVRFGLNDLKIPIVSANMDTITGPKMAITMHQLGGIGILHRFCTTDQAVEDFLTVRSFGADAAVSLGTSESLDRFLKLYSAGAKMFCIDVAHGHSKAVGKMIKTLRDHAGSSIYIIAGNVATYAGADYLSSCGADAIKVGIGPGSVCTTRIKTGCGVPQLTAIMDCARVQKTIIADGGIKTPGDAVKALAAGADLVMIGGMLSGTEETPGDVLKREDGSKYKVFRGMASREAQEDFMGQQADWKTSEGVSIEVSYKGSARDVVSDITGGIRSGLTYCGADSIEMMHAKVEFMEITSSAYTEGTPHGKNRL
jgi:IMP dehydrogenase